MPLDVHDPNSPPRGRNWRRVGGACAFALGLAMLTGSVVLTFAGIWSHGDLTARLFGTAFAAFIVGFVLTAIGGMEAFDA